MAATPHLSRRRADAIQPGSEDLRLEDRLDGYSSIRAGKILPQQAQERLFFQDPKEYLALLNELDSKTPDAYRRYHIDLRLEDWASALEHIAHVDERFDECVQHIKRHDMYSKALSVFRGTPNYKVRTRETLGTLRRDSPYRTPHHTGTVRRRNVTSFRSLHAEYCTPYWPDR